MLKATISIFIIALVLVQFLPPVSAQGVCTGIPPGFGRFDNVYFSNHTIATGYTITIVGNITSLTPQDLHGHILIQSTPSPHGRWTIISVEPSIKQINITQFSRIPFSMTIKALQPGTYQLTPAFYMTGVGQTFSMPHGCNPEPTVMVTGKSICEQGLVGIQKVEDNSSVCVKPETSKILIERGWGHLP
ncbi:MAG TPA: hypothetical protein VFJ23_08115 [Candidatus Nitrosotalea sp.]|nr:hypothetical protein [Candidatus Nitrosotalea sp.]